MQCIITHGPKTKVFWMWFNIIDCLYFFYDSDLWCQYWIWKVCQCCHSTWTTFVSSKLWLMRMVMMMIMMVMTMTHRYIRMFRHEDMAVHHYYYYYYYYYYYCYHKSNIQLSWMPVLSETFRRTLSVLMLQVSQEMFFPLPNYICLM